MNQLIRHKALLTSTAIASLIVVFSQGLTSRAKTVDATPILGPFLAAGRQKALVVSNFTTQAGKDVAEYGHLFNMRSVTGFGQDTGAKTNLGVFTYAEANSGNVWGSTFDLQLATGSQRINADSVEVDLNNYRTDYAVSNSGVAVGLQMFFGGPKRSSTAIAIGEHDNALDPAHLVNGITLCCTSLISDSSFLDLTNSKTSVEIGGNHIDGIRFAASSTFKHRQIDGKGWSVDSDGNLIAKSLTSDLRKPSSSKMPCRPGEFEDDADYHYVCVSSDKWKRVRLSDF